MTMLSTKGANSERATCAAGQVRRRSWASRPAAASATQKAAPTSRPVRVTMSPMRLVPATTRTCRDSELRWRASHRPITASTRAAPRPTGGPTQLNRATDAQMPSRRPAKPVPISAMAPGFCTSPRTSSEAGWPSFSEPSGSGIGRRDRPKATIAAEDTRAMPIAAGAGSTWALPPRSSRTFPTRRTKAPTMASTWATAPSRWCAGRLGVAVGICMGAGCATAGWTRTGWPGPGCVDTGWTATGAATCGWGGCAGWGVGAPGEGAWERWAVSRFSSPSSTSSCCRITWMRRRMAPTTGSRS